MSYDLRPLSLAELLDRAFGLYRQHFLLFVGIMAVPSLAMLIMAVLGQLIEYAASPAAAAPANPDQAMVLILGVFGAITVVGLLYWVMYAVALGASTAAVARIYNGQPATISGSYEAMRGRIGRLAWLVLQVALRLFGVMLLIGAGAAAAGAIGSQLHVVIGAILFLLLVVGGGGLFVWMALRYAIAVPPSVLEDATARESIARSVELTRGSRWRVLVLVFFTVLVNWAALFLFQWPFMVAAIVAGPETSAGFWFSMAGAVTGAAASALTSPLAVVAMAVLYYDLRVRKEGLDLEMMIAGLRSDSTLPPPPDAGGRGFLFPS